MSHACMISDSGAPALTCINADGGARAPGKLACDVMLADHVYGSRLRPELAHLLVEAYFDTDCERIEIGSDDATAMKVNESAVGCLDSAETLIGVELYDPAVQGRPVRLHLPPTPPAAVPPVGGGWYRAHHE